MRLVALLTLVCPWFLPAQATDLDRVREGREAPDFSAVTPENRVVRLRDYQDRNVVLVFYRGHW